MCERSEKRRFFSYDVAPIRLIGSSTSWSVLLEAMTEEKPMAATSFLLGRMSLATAIFPKKASENKSIFANVITGRR